MKISKLNPDQYGQFDQFGQFFVKKYFFFLPTMVIHRPKMVIFCQKLQKVANFSQKNDTQTCIFRSV